MASLGPSGPGQAPHIDVADEPMIDESSATHLQLRLFRCWGLRRQRNGRMRRWRICQSTTHKRTTGSIDTSDEGSWLSMPQMAWRICLFFISKVQAQTEAPLNTGTGQRSATTWSHSCTAIQAPRGVATNDRVICSDSARTTAFLGIGRGTFLAGACIQRCFCLCLYLSP